MGVQGRPCGAPAPNRGHPPTCPELSLIQLLTERTSNKSHFPAQGWRSPHPSPPGLGKAWGGRGPPQRSCPVWFFVCAQTSLSGRAVSAADQAGSTCHPSDGCSSQPPGTSISGFISSPDAAEASGGFPCQPSVKSKHLAFSKAV